MGKIIKYHIAVIVVFSIVWPILNEKFSLFNIALGGILGLFSILITDKLIIKNPNKMKTYFNLPLVRLTLFLFFLIFQIFKSGILAIRRMFSKDVITKVIDVKTDIYNEFLITVIANAITLTPGTVTIDRQGDTLRVLTFCQKNEKDEIMAENIMRPINNLLKE